MAQTGVVSWSQTAASNAAADSNVAWPEGMAPSQVNDSARAMMASGAKWRDDLAGALLTGGTSTAFTLTSNQNFSSLTVLSGQLLCVRFHVTSGTSPTLNVDGLGAKAIQIDSSTSVTTATLRKQAIHYLTYDNSIPGFIVHMGHSLIEPGRLAMVGYGNAPPGWLLCNGQAVSRTTYADLFSIISTNYGIGDGSTTFNVPNFVGHVPAGVDSGATYLSGIASLGTSTGGGTVTLAQANLPNVNFTVSGITLNNGATSVTSNVTNSGTITGATTGVQLNGVASTGFDLKANTNFTVTSNVTVSSQGTAASGGSGTAINVAQPTLAVNYIIKT